MQIEISDAAQSELERAASAAGMSPSEYARLLLEERLCRASQSTAERGEAIDRLLEHMRTAAATSGRDGRRWREFVHEGHGR